MGRSSSISKSVLLPCSVFSAVNQFLRKGWKFVGHDQEVRSIGTIHYFYDYVFDDAAHTRVIFMRCYSSRLCFGFFLTGVGMSGFRRQITVRKVCHPTG